MVRTPSCDKNGMKKGTWTPEEDRKLVVYVTKYGCWNWRQLPKFAGLKRCGKSCRLRWMNYLRPDLKRGNYTKEEEEIIMSLHQSMGNKWSTIAAQLPGRTDNEVKNYWHTHLKKRGDQQHDSSDKEFESSDTVESPNNDHVDHNQDSQLDSAVTPQILDTSSICRSTMSPQPLSLSDTASTTSCNKNSVSESNDNNIVIINNPIDAYYSEFGDDFWTAPFLEDNSYVSSHDFLTSFTDTEFLSSEFDTNYLLFADGNNFLCQEQYVQVG